MVKMTDLKCTACGMPRRLPAFGLPEGAEPRFCSFCKTDGMINLKKLRQLGKVAAKKGECLVEQPQAQGEMK